MYKKLIFAFLVFICGKAIAQPSQYTPMTAAGYQMKRVKVDSTLHIPSFCGSPSLLNSTSKMGALAMDTCNNQLYKWTNEDGWSAVGGTSIDTSSLSNRINSKIDSINRVGDSVKYYKNGVAYFAYIDSIGGGGSQDLQSVVNIGNIINGVDPNNPFQTSADLKLNSYAIEMNDTSWVNGGYHLTLNASNTKFTNDNSTNVIEINSNDGIRSSADNNTYISNLNYNGLTVAASEGINNSVYSQYSASFINQIDVQPEDLFPPNGQTIYGIYSSPLGGYGLSIYKRKPKLSFPSSYLYSNTIFRDDSITHFNYKDTNETIINKTTLIFNNNNSNNNTLYFPKDTSGIFAISVNNNKADSTGNIFLPLNYIDSIKRSTDSIFVYKNGSWIYQYKDSIGSAAAGGSDTAKVVIMKVSNATGTVLSKGEVVYLFGSTGNVASVKRANNKWDSTSAKTIGIVRRDIAIGDTGYITTQGQIEKLNLSAYNEGDVLWLDSLDGQMTKNKPSAPYHGVFIGVVERANAGNGLAYVKPQNGYELKEIHDVAAQSPSNNQVLTYESSTDLWKPKSISTVLGYTPIAPADTASMLSNYQLKGVPTVAYLSSDFTTTSTTAVNTNLSIAVEANTAYRIMINGTASKATSSTGMKIQISAPTGSTIKAVANLGGNAISTIANSYITAINTLGSTFATGVGVEVPFRVEGILVTGANAGNIILSGATVTSNTATIYANTLMTVSKAYGL